MHTIGGKLWLKPRRRHPGSSEVQAPRRGPRHKERPEPSHGGGAAPRLPALGGRTGTIAAVEPPRPRRLADSSPSWGAWGPTTAGERLAPPLLGTRMSTWRRRRGVRRVASSETLTRDGRPGIRLAQMMVPHWCCRGIALALYTHFLCWHWVVPALFLHWTRSSTAMVVRWKCTTSTTPLRLIIPPPV